MVFSLLVERHAARAKFTAALPTCGALLPPALGLRVRAYHGCNALFDKALHQAGFGCKILTPSTRRSRQTKAQCDVVLLDFSSVHPRASAFLKTYARLHVFYSPADFIISPQTGWAERSVTFGHAYLGGSITLVWKLVPWYPPGETPFSPVEFPEQPWTPLRGRVNSLQPRSHCGKPPSRLLSRPKVVFDPISGLLLTDGRWRI